MRKRRDRFRIHFHYLWRWLKELFTEDHPRTPFYQFALTPPLDEVGLMHRLIGLGFQWNYWSYHEAGEVINMRRCYVLDGTIRQEHVRIFKDGVVRAHDELAYEEDAIGHLRGETVRDISDATKEELRASLLEGASLHSSKYYVSASLLKRV